MSNTSDAMLAKIDADLKQAMRDKDETTKLTLRSVKTALTEASKVEDAPEIDEDGIRAVIQREAKRRRDAAAEFDKANRADLAAQERAELAVLERYLPQQMSVEDIEAVVAAVIAETGATSMRDIGLVMPTVMPRVAGRADGKQVNQVVRRFLST